MMVRRFSSPSNDNTGWQSCEPTSAHELADGGQGPALAKEGRGEKVKYIIEDHVVRDFSAFAGRLERLPELLDLLALVLDEEFGLGLCPHML